MTDINKGDKYVRVTAAGGYPENVGRTVTIQAVNDGRVHYAYDGTMYRIKTNADEEYSLRPEDFLARFRKAPDGTTPPYLVVKEPVEPNWSYAEADRLREAAAKACTEYNTYVLRKPDTYYPVVHFPADL